MSDDTQQVSLLERLRELGFVSARQGKDMVEYRGLLYAAHEAGLQGISSRVLQMPSAENGETTIVLATVEMADGRSFTGVGDANPTNVGRNIVPHAIRMAETRAKGRAFRDALNIGAVMAEEIGDVTESTSRPPSQAKQESAFLASISRHKQLTERAADKGYSVAPIPYGASGKAIDELVKSESERIAAIVRAKNAEQVKT